MLSVKINNNMYIDDERESVVGKLVPLQKQMENYRVIADVVARECGVKKDERQKNEGNRCIKN